NSILYADGSGALVVACASAASNRPTIETVDLRLNEEDAPPGITFPAMLSAMPPTPERYASADYLGHHDFRRVLRRGSKLAAQAAHRVMEKMGVAVGDARFFVTHQATGNIRRISASHALPPDKVAVNIEK